MKNSETLEGLRFITTHFGTKGIRAVDRGYDNKLFYEYFIYNVEEFVIGSKKNRNVIHNDKFINILELSDNYKGKYAITIKNEAGVFKRWKIEEYFRFKKQQFNFEDIRVRSLTGIKAMNLLYYQ